MTFRMLAPGMFPSTGQPSEFDYLDRVKLFAIREGAIPFKFIERSPIVLFGHQT
jgi:hypothetical protein